MQHNKLEIYQVRRETMFQPEPLCFREIEEKWLANERLNANFH